ncbi:hypothetical protein HDU67_008363 [Dinochytrium kinnereticum]|nr:hypothetical protein HDU67_008363 [Dinochytrium kinnereticum]
MPPPDAGKPDLAQCKTLPAPLPREDVLDAGPSPYDRASFLSRITFSWINPLILQGWRAPLEQRDLYRINAASTASSLVEKLQAAWNAELSRLPSSKSTASVPPPKLTYPKKETGPSLLRAIITVFWNEVAPIGFLEFSADICSIFSPLLVKYIIDFVARGNGGIGEGLGLAFGLLSLQILETILSTNHFQLAGVAGLRIKTALTAIVYRKSLRLSAAARQEYNAGTVVNIISTDCDRIDDFVTYFHLLWTSLVQLPILMAFLYSQLGWASLVGVSLLLVLGPIQGRVTKLLSTIRKQVAPLADQRVKTTTEVLSGIRIIKFFAWEDSFRQLIEQTRTMELGWILKRSLFTALVIIISFGVPLMSSALTFVVYGLTSYLDPGRVFSSLSWFNRLRSPLSTFPGMWASYADCKVALSRIQSFLLAPELDDEAPIDPKATSAIRIIDGEFTWDVLNPSANVQEAVSGVGATTSKWFKVSSVKKSASATSVDTMVQQKEGGKSTLRNLNFAVDKGSLVAIVGPVGSGKSSLLSALAGEMKRVQGDVMFSGRLGYAPQIPWIQRTSKCTLHQFWPLHILSDITFYSPIQNATVEQNITFGLPFDEDKYKRAIRDCALERDLDVLPAGDQTSIGERGINLSGGQKQRINLARCVYFNPDIVLLDDPLSAVDTHVGRHLFEQCILGGSLAGKTRILVTHQLHFLAKVDRVIVMRDGEVVEDGTYRDLVGAGGEFAELIRTYGGGEVENVDKEEVAIAADLSIEEEGEKRTSEEKTATANIMKDEERAVGAVRLEIWWSYVVASGGWSFVASLMFALFMVQAVKIGNDIWLVWWSGDRFKGSFSIAGYIGVYMSWGVAQIAATYCFGVFFAFTSTRAARTLHESALTRVLQAPISFLDTTPIGRVLNRFSKDQDSIDNLLGPVFRIFVSYLATAVSTFIVVSYATPMFVVPVVALGGGYYFVQKVYRCASRELKRLESVSRSPLYANFGETLTGLATIRAYREQERFIHNSDIATDANNSPSFLLITVQRWIQLRLQVMGSLLVFFAALFGVLSKNSIDPALLGLSLTYALQITDTLSFIVRIFSETEIAMNAVERVRYYATQIPTEADAVVASNRPPPGWPGKGNIQIKNLFMKYGPELPLVLKGVSFDVRDGEKIGIVGRTGSGKSSLVQALFRMVEPTSGEIVIDGIGTQTIGLKDLRSALAIIPQDPVLFSGTYRSNLDPFNQFTDAELWDAVTRVGLKSKLSENDAFGLDNNIEEGGENLSVGQRQLVCLARAMLKKTRILVMDEATANVDYETDALIQRALREDFADVTILTIAHRLNTIIDYDRILVMNDGRVSEYDSPSALLGKEDSIFRSMRRRAQITLRC